MSFRPKAKGALLAALLAFAALLALAPAASARKPIISYLDAQEKFQLHDAETGANVSPPPLVPVPPGGANPNVFRWGMSLDGRYIVFNDANKKLHLLDRIDNQQVPLPGIDKVANPGNLTVSNAGLIAFDNNSNEPTYVYDSLAKKFVDTGLGDADPSQPNNVQRQPRLSGDGNFMTGTCFDNAMTSCFTTGDSDSDVFLQNLATKQRVPNFPDEPAGMSLDEEHPCINNDGTLIAVEKPPAAMQDIDMFLFQRTGSAFAAVPTPNLNDPNLDDRFCQLGPTGGYISLLVDDVYKLYERSSASFIALPQLPFDTRSTLSAPYSPPSPSKTKCAGKQATQVGTSGRDVIRGTKKRDVIAALGGNDLVRSLGGNDLVCGGKGKEKLIGGKGKDTLRGNAGKDKLKGGKGKDILRGDAGKDKLFGGKGKDKLKGGKGKDKLVGGPGRDKLKGGPGKDQQTQ